MKLTINTEKFVNKIKNLTDEKIKDSAWNMETAMDLLRNETVQEAPSKTGNLRNPANWKTTVEVKGKTVIGRISSNVKYAVYVHQGTGRFAVNKNGRKGWWVYVPGSDVRGRNGKVILTKGQAIKKAVYMRKALGLNAKVTEGIKPNPFLRRALQKSRKEMWRVLSGK